MGYTQFTRFYGGPFSQWAPAGFTVNRQYFNCAEQYMMWRKAMLFADIESANNILGLDHPSSQKAFGRRVKNFDRDTWQSMAKSIVIEGNIAKFQQNTAYGQALEATKGTLLVEASPTDCIWGVGIAENDPNVMDHTKWRGTNWLGECLTIVRHKLFENRI